MPEPDHQPAARSRIRPVLLEVLGVGVFFTAVAVFATWPLAIHPLGGFYGFGNDNWGGIPYFGWLHDAYLGPAEASFDPGAASALRPRDPGACHPADGPALLAPLRRLRPGPRHV